MRITIKYIGIMDVKIPSRIDLPVNTTVDNVLLRLFGDNPEEDNFNVLINEKVASRSSILSEGDSLLILQVLGGG
ncbi:MAG: MoaD/ThiS family protein [Gudongella sp.]|nr:MoaD/ThiS family protein [Gudongella sp.]